MIQQQEEEATIVAACPVCGSYAGSVLAERSALLAVCDVLVIRTLEVAGKRIINGERDRGRFNRMGNRPWHEAHTLWHPWDKTVYKSLEKAWDVVPALLSSHGSCGVTPVRIEDVLDTYTKGLLFSGRPHSIEDLRACLQAAFGFEFPLTVGENQHGH